MEKSVNLFEIGTVTSRTTNMGKRFQRLRIHGRELEALLDNLDPDGYVWIDMYKIGKRSGKRIYTHTLVFNSYFRDRPPEDKYAPW